MQCHLIDALAGAGHIMRPLHDTFSTRNMAIFFTCSIRNLGELSVHLNLDEANNHRTDILASVGFVSARRRFRQGHIWPAQAGKSVRRWIWLHQSVGPLGFQQTVPKASADRAPVLRDEDNVGVDAACVLNMRDVFDTLLIRLPRNSNYGSSICSDNW